MTTPSCYPFQCWIIENCVIPKTADNMKTILIHRCYRSLFGEECTSNHRVGNLLLLVFPAEKITAIPINKVGSCLRFQRFCNPVSVWNLQVVMAFRCTVRCSLMIESLNTSQSRVSS